MKRIYHLSYIIFIIFLLSFLFTSKVKAQENKFGIAVAQYYSEKSFQDHGKWREHLDWAKSLVGAGGYVKFLFPWIGEADAPLDTYKSVVNESYARELNPIIRIQNGWVYTNRNSEIGLTGCWKRPPQNSGTTYSQTAGQYSEYAQTIASFVDSLPPPPSGRTMFIELWNEMNYDYIEWCDDQGNSQQEPENYARFYLEVYNRIQALGKPNIKVVNGGLGRGNPTGYLQKMLSTLSVTVGQNPSTLQNLFEYYATHVYPQTSSDETFVNGIGSFNQELEVLKRFGIDTSRVKVLVTEGGYIRGTSGTQLEDERQAKLNVELVKRLKDDSRVIAITPFSLDDHTDRTFYTLSSPLDSTLFVPSTSGTSNGEPTNARPVYNALKNLRTGNNTQTQEIPPECRDCTPTDKPYPIGYAIAEDQAIVNSLNEPLVYTRTFPTSIKYTFKDTTPGTKVIFVKYFYSNGGSKLVQATVRYRIDEVAQVCTPGQVLQVCKVRACNVGQDYTTNPNSQVLADQTGFAGPTTGKQVDPRTFAPGQRVNFTATSTNADGILVQIINNVGVAIELGTIQDSDFGQTVSMSIPENYPQGTAYIRFYARRSGLQQEQPSDQTEVQVVSQSVIPTPTPRAETTVIPTPTPLPQAGGCGASGQRCCNQTDCDADLICSSSNTCTPKPGFESCRDQCLSDVLRLNIGRDQSGACNYQTRSDSHICYSGQVGTRRVCDGQEYLCTDSGREQFYWTQIGVGAEELPVGEGGYDTKFICNEAGTAWTCANTNPIASCN